MAMMLALSACASASARVPAAAEDSSALGARAPTAAAADDPRSAPLPTVHVIATGGTISNTDDEGRLTGEQILASVSGLEDVAALTVEQFSNIASGRMTPSLWLALARRVDEVFAGRPEVSGVVVTHGTDTMEETAYFLDLVIGDDRPVLLTGAMRNASRLSNDGPANLYNAARVAVDPRARGLGAMVVLNDVALPAREATKLNTIRVEAFEAPGRGPLAVTDPDTVVFLENRGDRSPPLIDPAHHDDLPRVDIIFTYAGADGALVDAAVAAGARGLVMASVGRGGLTPGQSDAVERALEAGVVVVVSSRTLSGRVPVGDEERRLADWRPGRGIRLGAADLTPQKARILLMLALARDPDPRRVLDVFRTY
ncbi:MAG: asparaginase [Gemmatimonadetes bacterium]|nr:asparaginase [Gemmatimonadota bacterium]